MCVFPQEGVKKMTFQGTCPLFLTFCFDFFCFENLKNTQHVLKKNFFSNIFKKREKKVDFFFNFFCSLKGLRGGVRIYFLKSRVFLLTPLKNVIVCIHVCYPTKIVAPARRSNSVLYHYKIPKDFPTPGPILFKKVVRVKQSGIDRVQTNRFNLKF